MSYPTNFPPTSQALSQDPWQKPWAKGIMIGTSLGALYLIATLFLYEGTVMMDGMVNAAFITCAQGTFTYAGGHGITLLMKVITTLGGKLFLSLATCVICVWFYLKKMPSLTIFFGLQMIIGTVFNHTLKHAFNRPRPNVTCLDHGIWSGSFPSGHTMMSTIFLATLTFLLTRMPACHASRSFITINAITLGLAIGISRLYLGVHWFSDVMGGWLFGLLWTIIGLNLLTYWEHRSYAHHP